MKKSATVPSKKSSSSSPYGAVIGIIVLLVAIMVGLVFQSQGEQGKNTSHQQSWEYYYEKLLRWIPSYNSNTSPQSSSGIVALYYKLDGINTNKKKVIGCGESSSLAWIDEMTVGEATGVFNLSPEQIVSDESLVQERIVSFMALRGGCIAIDKQYGFILMRRNLLDEGFNDFVRRIDSDNNSLKKKKAKKAHFTWMVESKSQSSDWKDTIFLNRHKPWRAFRSDHCVPFGSGYGGGSRSSSSQVTMYSCKDTFVKMIVFGDESVCTNYQQKYNNNDNDDDDDDDDDLDNLDEEPLAEGSIVLEHDYSFQNYRRFCI